MGYFNIRMMLKNWPVPGPTICTSNLHKTSEFCFPANKLQDYIEECLEKKYFYV